MTNMKADHRGNYRFRTAEDGEAIEVKVFYDLGGANYFSGGHNRRGIAASITPVKFEHGCVSFTLFSGTGVFLVPLARKNDKRLAQVAELLDAVAPEVARLFGAGDKAAAVALLRGAVTPQQEATA